MPGKKYEMADRPQIDMAQILGYTVPQDKELETTMPSLKDAYRIREDVDVKKLHEPEDFVRECEEFANEAHAQLSMIEHFAEAHKLPYLNTAVDACRDAFERLEKEIKDVAGELAQKAEAEAKQEAAPSSAGQSTTFKRV